MTSNLIRFFRSLSFNCIVAKTVRKRIGRKINSEIGGQSGERSQRAVKRQIYSLNRLLNGISTHKLVAGEALESSRIVLMRHSTNHLVLPAIENW